MAKQKKAVKRVKKVEINPNDYPDQTEYLEAKRKLEQERKE